ncbi:hypothetical protein E4T66_17125 [Sinimarinibacterium sp. CAU 1509]|uniref:hypothetical protein n=1 Tax=Sinimarinibacterium sp. CAU 1509 TaxID=2562283 RepID=UPI0010ABD941|nr:hypothetical protein [Sinimarinibacterium sp. CAU 1509]TJY57133.1 hypothetical protein E4T66_17125 [Sinimarinibacterium sp. CAU 1509]
MRNVDTLPSLLEELAHRRARSDKDLLTACETTLIALQRQVRERGRLLADIFNSEGVELAPDLFARVDRTLMLGSDTAPLVLRAGDTSSPQAPSGTTQPQGPRMHKWIPTTNLMQLRRFGKLIEELGELDAAMKLPSLSDKVWTEVADVLAQLDETVVGLRLASGSVTPTASASPAELIPQLSSIAARCIIQGIDEVDPGTGLTNRVRLENGIASLYRSLNAYIDARMPERSDDIAARRLTKRAQMQAWEALFAQDGSEAVV